MTQITVDKATLENLLSSFKKIRDDKHSYWNVDEEIATIEKALTPIAMAVMKTDEADFWRWWRPYQLKDCWRLELVARDAWMAAKATQQEQEPVIECDCKTTISPDGTKTTRCGSDQMRRACEEGHAFSGQAQKQEPVAWLCDWDGHIAAMTQKPEHKNAYRSVTPLYTSPPQRQTLTDAHRESGMTSDELWLSNGKLRAEMADLKVQLKQLRENERQVCADELMAFANRHRNLHSAGMTDLDHCVVYTLETNAYLLRTRFYENHLPKEAAHGIKGEA